MKKEKESSKNQLRQLQNGANGLNISQEVSLVKHGLGTTNITSIFEAEQINLKVNPNTVKFKDIKLEKQFKDYLLSDDQLQATGEFKFNLLIFFSFYFLVIIFNLAMEVLNILKNKQELWISTIGIAILGILLISGVLVYTLILSVEFFRVHSLYMLIYIIVLLQAYLILLGKDFINKYLDQDTEIKLDNSLFICGNIYMAYLVLFSNYLGITLVCTFTILLYFISQIMLGQEYYQSILNITVLSCICFAFSINAYKTEKLMKTIYIEKCKDQIENDRIQETVDNVVIKQSRKTVIQNKAMDQYIYNQYNKSELSEADKILILLHNVIRQLIYSSEIIIYSDVKKRLIDASKDVEYVLKKILTQDDLFKIQIGELFSSKDISEEDKAFVLQNYQDPVRESASVQRSSVERRNSRRKSTLLKNIEHVVFIEQLSPEIKKLLKKVGCT